MPVYPIATKAQPIISLLGGYNTVVSFANGWVECNWQPLEWSTKDWTRDTLLIAIDFLTKDKPRTMSACVFPMTIDVVTDTNQTQSFGWSVDDVTTWWDDINSLVVIQADMAVKSINSELLRVGYQLIVHYPAPNS